jgi:hypothetical protein
MIELASHEDNCKVMLGGLPDKILQPIEDAQITNVVREASVDGLREAIQTIVKANGGNTSEKAIGSTIRQKLLMQLITG